MRSCKTLKFPETEAGAVRPGRLFILFLANTYDDRDTRHIMPETLLILSKSGCPGAFLTTTCNFQWLENKNVLFSKEHVVHCLSISARVVHIKLDSFMVLISDGLVLGELKAHVKAIEFQCEEL